MASQAKILFDKHLVECSEAIALYDHLEKTSIYRPDFSLRFVWIATISAFDHYISQLILERATEAFANGEALSPKLMSDAISFSNALELRSANTVESIILFRNILNGCVRYKRFQSPDKVAEGLSYIWLEKHKWQFISKKIGADVDVTKAKLENIVSRRNLIAHNADFDEARKEKIAIKKQDTIDVVDFIRRVTDVIDIEIYRGRLAQN